MLALCLVFKNGDIHQTVGVHAELADRSQRTQTENVGEGFMHAKQRIIDGVHQIGSPGEVRELALRWEGGRWCLGSPPVPTGQDGDLLPPPPHSSLSFSFSQTR